VRAAELEDVAVADRLIPDEDFGLAPDELDVASLVLCIVVEACGRVDEDGSRDVRVDVEGDNGEEDEGAESGEIGSKVDAQVIDVTFKENKLGGDASSAP